MSFVDGGGERASCPLVGWGWFVVWYDTRAGCPRSVLLVGVLVGGRLKRSAESPYEFRGYRRDICHTFSNQKNSVIAITELQTVDDEIDIFRGLRIPNMSEFPVEDFFKVPFTHHIHSPLQGGEPQLCGICDAGL